MTVIKKAWLLSSDEAYKLITPVVIELFDELEMDPRSQEDVSGKLGFTPFEATTKDGQIQTQLWVEGTPLVGEFDSFVLDEDKYGNKISYDVERVFPAEGMSSEAKKWIERARGATDIAEPLRKDLADSISRISRKVKSIKITQNEFKTLVFTKWFDTVSADTGYGSAVYDGKQLFADDHIIVDTGDTYSNVIDDWSSQHAPLTYTALQHAVEMLREMKDWLGTRVKRPTSGIYDLVVSPELEQTALDVLSDLNGFQPYNYAGTEATNDNFSNVFMTRAGFKVRLTVLETMNQPSTLIKGETVGSDVMWFVINKENAREREAFRDISFWDVEIELFYDKTKKATFITAEKHFGAQALYPEIVVGSKWDSSAI